MFRTFSLLVVLSIPYYIISCNANCNGQRISFRLLLGNKGENFKIYVNGVLKSEVQIEETFFTKLPSNDKKQFDFCAIEDTINVKVSVNKKDTSFNLISRDIIDCYVGMAENGDFVVINNYVEGGFREFSPVR